jgi:hypothetical protein
LLNPRYTGRQVWNNQRKEEILLDVDDRHVRAHRTATWKPFGPPGGRSNNRWGLRINVTVGAEEPA